MLINIPIAFYSSALLLVLHVLETTLLLDRHGSSVFDAAIGTVTATAPAVSISLLILPKLVVESAPMTLPSSIQILRICGWVPIVVTLLVLLWDLPRRWNLRRPQSRLYDSDGNPVRRRGNGNNTRFFLPDRDHCHKEDYERVYRSLSITAAAAAAATAATAAAAAASTTTAASTAASTTTTSERASWALVTGASKGIGRAIAISLARRNIPLVLVARNLPKLEGLVREIRECYGITAIPLKCDLSKSESIDALLETLRETSTPTSRPTPTPTVSDEASDEPSYDDNTDNNNKLIDGIDILINNAGLGDSCCFFEDGIENSSSNNINQMESMIRLNVLGATRLTQAIGNAMNDRVAKTASNKGRHCHPNLHPKGGRIAFVSSIMGALPGVPGQAVYAATKAYQRSLCTSLGRELEASSDGRITVLCVLPGAVTHTGFAGTAHMTESAVFHLLPGCGLVLTPQQVAEATVIEAISGVKREVFVGWMYFLKGAILSKLVPDRATTLLAELVTKHVSVFESWGIITQLLFLGGERGDSGDDPRIKGTGEKTKKDD
jgi:short-subunit dehydrogenase